MKIRNLGILIGILAVAGFTIWLNVSKFDESKAKGKEVTAPVTHCQGKALPVEGYCAPDFTLATADGKKVELYQNNGKPTIVNFWATWCGYCQEEMSAFQKAYDQYKNRVNFIMVNETAMERTPQDVSTFLKKTRYTFPVALDSGQNGKTVGINQYHLFGVPTTFVVGEDGKIKQKRVGGLAEKEIYAMIKELAK
jgi:thiol-disulfide isomerase/thioredoxin